MSTTPAGWYPDPAGSPFERYWDGEAWTEQLHSPVPDAAPPAAPPAAPKRRSIAPILIAAAAVLVVAAVAVIVVVTRSASDAAHATPDVTGKSPAEANAILEDAGFTWDYLNLEPGGAAMDTWRVTSQDPAAGERSDDKKVDLRAGTPLMDVGGKCSTPAPVDSGMTLVIDVAGSEAGSGTATFSDVECALDVLGAPSAILSKMGETRALDGRQSDEWSDFEVSWSYHPDQGLDVIIELHRS